MSSLADSYLIIGSGVFGASTALHLSRQTPAPKVTLVDRLPYPCPIAASHDINKIVRSDYGDIFYCKLGLKTLEKWRTDPLFSKWYHQSGLLKATDHAADLVNKIFENYRELGVDVGAELIGPGELKTRFEGVYADTDLTDVEKLLWNPSCGWADAEYALRDTVQACVENGVRYVTASVAKLVLESGTCTGVVAEDGRRLTAQKVILSTGAFTAKLLADSAPMRRDLQVGDRIVAAGVCEAYVSLDAQQVERFKDVPAFVLDANETQGETMPPTRSGQLKFIRDIPFLHNVKHHASGQKFSIPFVNKDRSQWTTPDKMPNGIKEEIRTCMSGIYGKEIQDLEVSAYRFCWDGITQDSNWYISKHPRCQNLFIATAGSFHGWKFLPVIGEYVVQMLKDELPEGMRKRWDWDRNLEGIPRNVLIPKRETDDLSASGPNQNLARASRF